MTAPRSTDPHQPWLIPVGFPVVAFLAFNSALVIALNWSRG